MTDAGGQVANAALNAEARAMERVKYGTRARAPPPPPPEAARRLNVRLRSDGDDGGINDVDMIIPPARRPRRASAVLTEESCAADGSCGEGDAACSVRGDIPQPEGVHVGRGQGGEGERSGDVEPGAGGEAAAGRRQSSSADIR